MGNCDGTPAPEQSLTGCTNRHGLRRAAAQPPDQPAGDHEKNRDQLVPRHRTTKHRSPASIIANEFQEKPRHAVKNQVSAKHLAIEFLPSEHPHQNKEISQLHGRLKELRGLERLIQWSTHQVMSHWVGKSHTPNLSRRLAIAAASSETAYPS